MTNDLRLTLPIERGLDEEIRALMQRLGADAVRNLDGTELPDWVIDESAKVYATYFCARGDEEWASLAGEERVRQFLMSTPTTAPSSAPLTINVMEGYLPAQFAPDPTADINRYWQVIDRTTGKTLPHESWSVVDAAPLPLRDPVRLVGELPVEAKSAIVTIANPEPFHVYTVNFLAKQIWDSTQIYNYLTNEWAKDPNRVKSRPYDVAYPRTWERVQSSLSQWLQSHPEVDVVRFTTFFYHFTLTFDDRAREKYVDWFGYSASVSVPALEDFAKEYGYALTPEDFVDAGYYNSPFRPPRAQFLDWVDFLSRRVSRQAQTLVKTVHDAGREAMMFLGDNWIGTEPYGRYFSEIGLDAVVGSVGSAATCRMISDIPGVRYTEGRFLPYFFPDVFSPGGDPVAEANESWLAARRAIVRSPLDRIGYGGYLSLAMKFPDFIDRVEEIINEFRQIHQRSGGHRPANAQPVIGILNAWGALRTWQTHMVAHALWYKQIYSYQGVIESLAGLPFEVRFISFDEVINDPHALAGIDVIINAGARGTAFSGGPAWNDITLQERLRAFVYAGGGLIGVGSPTARDGEVGTTFALADVFGVDQEIGWGLSTDRYSDHAASSHFITTDIPQPYDFGEDPGDIVSLGAKVLYESDGSIRLAVNEFGQGRAVYCAGLPYTSDNSRLLHRALVWAAKQEKNWDHVLASSNSAVEVAWYPQQGCYYAYNNTLESVTSMISGHGLCVELALQPMEGRWGEISDAS
ncbi:1,3-beta-galactosyl-N-acetylhexosamine phosphorylase [Actinomycetaceae bacterium WB03_NA08]|uniref:1,3-beta-galactosyl-N-acetylhexosamine phosphorylase n=1 Tax=Scrofimicrobium canadense TaxID=2652290 RepID=A0A6N7W5K1_9ACTO|nr:1,3-beta-galactosyl-N-acetylhexosamine phosphorylase [Scrofimicrobium canadense]MSS84681.1 1,3-beta-galactosyl-N-acetylhexosamine phosphorylase [Scrofimicrobium canadense]